MAFRVRRGGWFWLVFVSVVIASALFGASQKANAYPGNVAMPAPVGTQTVHPDAYTGNISWGYITTGDMGIDQACNGCHSNGNSAVGPTNVTMNGAALTEGANFNVVANTTNNPFKIQFTPAAGRPGAGFLVVHTDTTTNDAGGLLKPGTGLEKSCKSLNGATRADWGPNVCGLTTAENTEVMHAQPHTASGGVIEFNFLYNAPSCGTYKFRVWINNVNGDLSCGTVDASKPAGDLFKQINFTITVGCPASPLQCAGAGVCSAGSCNYPQVTSGACNDGNACTLGDTCGVGGVCAGTAKNCDDGNVCTVDSCNTGTGACINNTAAPSNTVCRASGGECDPAETCGGATTCPGDAKSNAVCRGVNPGDVCDVAESCDGVSNTCPADKVAAINTTCRGAVSVCDVAEVCDGSAKTCPAIDVVAPFGTTCRGASDLCDAVEKCNGVGNTCPLDATIPAGTQCRAANGVCDVAEACQGGNDKACPGNGFATPATQCRAANGVCDVAENCSGSSASCPADAFANGTVCRSSAGSCDVVETCDGNSGSCPSDSFLSSATVCRSSNGICDTAENCTGSTALCPNDSFKSGSTQCRAGSGVCNPAENCSGSAAACPPDTFTADDTNCAADGNPCTFDVCKSGVCNSTVPNGTECGNSSCTGTTFQPPKTCTTGTCGAAPPTQSCTPFNCNVSGTSCANSCVVDVDCPTGFCDATQNPRKCLPLLNQGGACLRDSQCGSGTCVDGFCCNAACNGSCQACSAAKGASANGTCTNLGAAVTCRTSAGPCDVAEKCNGTANCPADAFQPTTQTCGNPVAGECDVAEKCSGSSATCPADGVATVVQLCRASAGDCDPAETCNGSDKVCPGNAFSPATQQCRASGGACDKAETCTGITATCPADTLSPANTPCRVAAGDCDAAEVCTGSAAACPPDAKKGAGVSCRVSAGTCDVPEACDGTAVACPPDAFLPATAQCRASAGGCDIAENCSGSAAACPADVLQTSAFTCTAASCASNVATSAQTCSGSSATCAAAPTTNCGNFGCAGTACRTTCSVDTECNAGSYCATGGKCTPRGTPGQTCAADNQCNSSFCIEGVCCNSECTDQCASCTVPGKAGTCSPVVNGPPVAGKPACPGNGTTCGGICNGVETKTCAVPGANVVCRPGACAAGNATLEERCDGAGSCPTVRTQTCGATGCDGALCTGCKVDGDCTQGSFCRGGVCTAFAENGATCSRADECVSGLCVDGLCCDSRCDGQCEACNVPGKPGVCSAVSGKPVNPRAACTGDASTCGGTCDGTNRRACAYPGYGVVCNEPSCTTGRATVVGFCNGAGRCPAPETQDCPADCDATGTICNGDCAGTCSNFDEYCSAGVCVPRKSNGISCSSAAECGSGYCVDGACCDQACDGQCQACDVPNSVGECKTVSGAPHGARQACTGNGGDCAGACDGSDAEACKYPGGEKSCRLGTCTGGVAVFAAKCQGNGNCAPLQQQRCPAGCAAGSTLCAGNCTTDAGCGQGNFCSAGICSPLLANGEVCGVSSQCGSAHCVDGVCCDKACDGQCEACDVVGSIGACAPAAGYPRNGRAACPGSGVCSGFCNGTSRDCAPSSGVTCGEAYCASGFSTAAATCSNTSCLPTTPTACNPFQCSADGTCLDSCVSDGDCADGLVCDGGACVPPTDEPDAGNVPDASVGTGGGTGTGGRTATGGRTGSGGRSGTGGKASGGSSTATGGSSEETGGSGTVDGGTPDAGNGSGTSSDKGDCGCRLQATGSNSGTGAFAAAGLLAALLVVRRRRQRGSSLGAQ